MIPSRTLGAGGSTPVQTDVEGARRRRLDPSDVEAVARYQEEIGAPERAVRAARSLREPGAVIVVTGQQPGLLGGPILTLAKALTAVAVAEELAQRHTSPVVPVFWVASEDHDLDEANRVDVLTAGDRLERLSIDREPDGTMLSRIDPGDEALRLLDDVEALLPSSEFLKDVMAPLRSAAASSLSKWFAGILSRWLGDCGLVLVEPDHFRSAARPILELEHRRPGAIVKALGRGPLEPASPPFFRIENGRRVRPASVSELPDDPESVSFDVVTRVLAQNVALPVAAHVVGPHELEYCRQIAPAHDLFDVPAPPLIPRASLVLVESKVEKALDRFGASLEDVLAEGEAALRSEETKPEDFDSALSDLESALESAYPSVVEEAEQLDETLLRKAEGAEREILSAIDRLRDHGRKALERVTGVDAERRRKLLAHLLPEGVPQERVLSPLPFLARHGMGLLTDLADVVRTDPTGRRAVFLGRRRR